MTGIIATSTLLLVGCTSNADQQTEVQEVPPADQTDASDSSFEVDESAVEKLPETIADSGTLTVATDPTFPPYEFTADDNETLVGFDIDMTNAVGDVLGVDIEFVSAKFDSIIPGLQSNRYDMSVSAFGLTEERMERIDLVPYASSGDNLAVQEGNPDELSTDWESLCGTDMALAQGTLQAINTAPAFSQNCEEAGEDPIEIDLYPDEHAATLALISGRADAKLSDAMSLAYEVQNSDGQIEMSGAETINTVPVGMALAKDSELTPAIVAALKAIAEDPNYADIIADWEAPEDLALDPASIEVNPPLVDEE